MQENKEYEMMYHVEYLDGELAEYPFYFLAENDEKAIAIAKEILKTKLHAITNYFSLYESDFNRGKKIYEQKK